ncbi:MAG: polyhydroxyalkanoic acid system family protein [Myxococcales bacterium]|nr:polyhydroxyalkanoic acid system family protein [Myxococcales bacterium]
MATIEISRAHTLSKEDAKKKAEELAKSMETKLGLAWKWVGDQIEFNAPSGAAKGTKGFVRVSDTSVDVAVDLPLMLRVMKGTIEEKVNEKLKTLL